MLDPPPTDAEIAQAVDSLHRILCFLYLCPNKGVLCMPSAYSEGVEKKLMPPKVVLK